MAERKPTDRFNLFINHDLDFHYSAEIVTASDLFGLNTRCLSSFGFLQFISTVDKDAVSAASINSAISLGHVQAQVVKLVRVCQLGSSQLEEAGRRDLWFPLLDVLLSIQPQIAHHQTLAHGERYYGTVKPACHMTN